MSYLLTLLRKAQAGNDEAAWLRLFHEMDQINWSPDYEFRRALAEAIRQRQARAIAYAQQETADRKRSRKPKSGTGKKLDHGEDL